MSIASSYWSKARLWGQGCADNRLGEKKKWIKMTPIGAGKLNWTLTCKKVLKVRINLRETNLKIRNKFWFSKHYFKSIAVLKFNF